MRGAHVWWLLLTAALAVFIAVTYRDVLANPNAVLLAGAGDGMKNYFTYAWHAEHDHGLLHFGGSGFPYGDHVFYTDCHPILTWWLQAFPSLGPWKIGILNGLLVLGRLLCAWCVFGIFRHFRLPGWASAVCAFGIALLEPQAFRMTGHLALAHAWVIPLIWYTWLRARGASNAGRILLCSAAVLAAFLIHPYLGLMGAMFLLAYQGIAMLVKGTRVPLPMALRDVLITVAFPLLLFLVMERASDLVSDRPTEQWGQERYASRWQSLLVPLDPPFGPLFTHLVSWEEVDWESWSYLGMSSIVALLVLLVIIVRGRLRRSIALPVESIVSLFAGVVVLLFAMNVWQPLLGKVFGSLLQFRAMGRFAWVFYYVCAVVGSVAVHNLLFRRPRPRSWVAAILFLLFASGYVAEGWVRQVRLAGSMTLVPNPFTQANEEEDREYLGTLMRSGAVAIIPLPYTHVGSDLYQRDAPEHLLSEMYALSYRSGLPLMAGNMIRTSASHTRELIAILSPPEFEKTLADSFVPETCFALFNDGSPMDADEERLWALGAPLHEGRAFSLRLVDAASLFQSGQEDRMRHFAEHSDSLFRKHGWWLEEMDRAGGRTDRGKVVSWRQGVRIDGESGQYTTLLRLPAGYLDTALTYELSMLFEAMDPFAVNTSVLLESQRPTGGIEWESAANLRGMTMHAGDMTIATMRFRPRRADAPYHVFMKGPDGSKARFTVRHLLLRPIGVDAWRQGTWFDRPALFWNGIPLALDPREDDNRRLSLRE